MIFVHGVFWLLQEDNKSLYVLHHKYNSVDYVAIEQTLRKLQLFIDECA